MREGPMPVGRAVNIAIQACRGLDAAHAAGIVHRDLKPENLFLCRRGDGSDLVKILDFGIAKLSGPEGSANSMTRTGSTMGTPFYMSPEQARGAKELDHRADVYSLGVILFEALSGQKPHPGDSYNAILYHILTQPPTPLGLLRPGLPPELVAIVHRTLASLPSERPASAVQLARDLAPFAGRQLTPFQSQFELSVARGPVRRPSGGVTVGPSPSPPTVAAQPFPGLGATPTRASGQRLTAQGENWPFQAEFQGEPVWETHPSVLRGSPLGRRLLLFGVGLSAALVTAGVLTFGLGIGRDTPATGPGAAAPAAGAASASASASVSATGPSAAALAAPAAPASPAPGAGSAAGGASGAASAAGASGAAREVPTAAAAVAETGASPGTAGASDPGAQRPRGQAGGRPRGQTGAPRVERTDRPSKPESGGEKAAKASDPGRGSDDADYRPPRPRRPVFDRSNPYQ
jgi:serine/threonine-protein kinase